MAQIMAQTKITKSARGEDCAFRFPDICNFNPETTVLAHVGSNSGMGMKPDDTEAAFCCSACHDAIDGRLRTNHSRLELKLSVPRAHGDEPRALHLSFDSNWCSPCPRG
mgnify:CR=1 FL=1